MNVAARSAITVDRLHALLRLGTTVLAVPQRDVRTLELASDVKREVQPPPGGAGWVEFARRRWPVYALSPELELVSDPDLSRGACVVIDGGQGLFGIVVDEVGRGEIAESTPLPAPMRADATPIEALARVDAGVACVSSAPALAAWIGARA